MPVREALRELEGEGVLDVFPHRGAVIRGVGRRFIRNLYDVRGAIEGMLASAAPSASRRTRSPEPKRGGSVRVSRRARRGPGRRQ